MIRIPAGPAICCPTGPQGTTFVSPWMASCAYFSWAEVMIFTTADTKPVDLECFLGSEIQRGSLMFHSFVFTL